MSRPFAVCVPARNEAQTIPTLFAALAAQTLPFPVPIALCANNCDDDTAAIAKEVAGRFDRIALTIVERHFAPANAHAGSARRCAMNLGAQIVGNDSGLLISTDADCRPPSGWIAANLAAAGEDHIVGGRILFDPQVPVPSAITGIQRRFDRYWQEVRAIEDGVDLLPWDAPPRHGDHTGASLAMTIGLYRRAGGVPSVATGEDIALVDAALAAGGRLMHPPAVWTHVSPRLDGRAAGGMAGVMREWLEAADAGTPIHVPHFDQWRRRAAWRRAHRLGNDAAGLAQAERALAPMACDMVLPE